MDVPSFVCSFCCTGQNARLRVSELRKGSFEEETKPVGFGLWALQEQGVCVVCWVRTGNPSESLVYLSVWEEHHVILACGNVLEELT